MRIEVCHGCFTKKKTNKNNVLIILANCFLDESRDKLAPISPKGLKLVAQPDLFVHTFLDECFAMN